jgi:hypothetical protein
VPAYCLVKKYFCGFLTQKVVTPPASYFVPVCITISMFKPYFVNAIAIPSIFYAENIEMQKRYDK